jgi:hypothetical protein
MAALRERFVCCGLTLHPEKTQVVYCKDSSRRGQFPQIQFTFLGYCFRPRMAKSRHGEIFTSFLPAVGPQALRRMRDKIRQIDLRRQTYLSLAPSARKVDASPSRPFSPPGGLMEPFNASLQRDRKS